MITYKTQEMIKVKQGPSGRVKCVSVHLAQLKLQSRIKSFVVAFIDAVVTARVLTMVRFWWQLCRTMVPLRKHVFLHHLHVAVATEGGWFGEVVVRRSCFRCFLQHLVIVERSVASRLHHLLRSERLLLQKYM